MLAALASTTAASRAATIYWITSNSDGTGAGTLRHALSQSGPRIVYYAATDTLIAASEIVITQPDCTLKGVTGEAIVGSRMRAGASRVQVMGMNIFAGGGVVGQFFGSRDCFCVGDSSVAVSNVRVAHCSFRGAPDEVFSVFGNAGVSNLLFEYNIVAGPIDTGHQDTQGGSYYLPSESHAFGCLVAQNTAEHGLIQFRCNLFGDGQHRFPQLKNTALIQLVNNVTYNTAGNSIQVSDDGSQYEIVGHYFKLGNNSDSSSVDKATCDQSSTPYIYMSGCKAENPLGGTVTAPTSIFRPRNGLPFDDEFAGTPFSGGSDPFLGSAMTADEGLAEVLAKAGSFAGGARHAAAQDLIDRINADTTLDRFHTSADIAILVHGDRTLPGTVSGGGYTIAGAFEPGLYSPNDGRTQNEKSIWPELGIYLRTAMDVASPSGQVRVFDHNGRVRVNAQSNGKLDIYAAGPGGAAEVYVDWVSDAAVMGPATIGATGDGMHDLVISINLSAYSGADGVRVWIDDTEIAGTDSGAGAPGGIDFDRTTSGILCDEDGVTLFWPFAVEAVGLYPHRLTPRDFVNEEGERAHLQFVGNPYFAKDGDATAWNLTTHYGKLNTGQTVTRVGTFVDE